METGKTPIQTWLEQQIPVLKPIAVDFELITALLIKSVPAIKVTIVIHP